MTVEIIADDELQVGMWVQVDMYDGKYEGEVIKIRNGFATILLKEKGGQDA